MRSNTTTTKAASRQSRGESVNQVQLIDRLVAAPDLRETPSGKHVTTVRVAVQAGSHPDFFDVVLWGQMADFATRYLTKGRLVYMAGRLS
ncbi:MAG: single-stranded DNA-binding protein [Firmicutes bacterium]|nr:single-stranded DNA-binding protein [Bacillota bacterium]